MSPEFKPKLFSLCTFSSCIYHHVLQNMKYDSSHMHTWWSSASSEHYQFSAIASHAIHDAFSSVPFPNMQLKFLGVCCQTQWSKSAILSYLLLKHLSCFSPNVRAKTFSESFWIVWLKWNYFSSRSHEIDRRCDILQHLRK